MIIFGVILFLANYILQNDNSRLFFYFMQGYLWLFLNMTNSYYNVDSFTVTPTQIYYIIVILSQMLCTTINLQITTIVIGQVYLLLSDDLLVTFISFELVNISLYLLICTYSSGIKYIITSLIITTFFIFGILLTFANNAYGWPILVVLLFKLGVFPFHQQTADQYDGISTNQMMIQQPIKLSIFLLMTTKSISIPILLGGIAILIPAISTQYTYTLKRFLSLSSASYQTLQILFLCSSTVANYSIVYIYTLGLIMISEPLIVALLFLSIAGLPPFIGFYYKVYLVSEQLEGSIWLLILFLVSSLILTANYLERSSGLTSQTDHKSNKMMTGAIGVIFFWSCYAL